MNSTYLCISSYYSEPHSQALDNKQGLDFACLDKVRECRWKCLGIGAVG